MKYPERILAWIIVCGFAAIALVTGAPADSFAETATAGKTVSGSATVSNPAFDKRLTTYLRKRFFLPDPKQVELGPMSRSGIAGVFVREVGLTNDMGQSGKAQVFSDAAGDQVIIGRLYDLGTIRADHSFDDRLRQFFKQQFHLPHARDAEIGPATQSPIPGLLVRQVTLSNEHGQTAKAQVFSDAAGRQVILGQLLDITKDPWERVDLSKAHLADRPTMGPANAPVTIVEFADFECPYCAHAFSVLETMVNTTYKGKVRLIFKNFPLNSHPWAVRAAVAADCAGLQNPKAFWSFAREFYTRQGSITPQNLQSKVDKTARRLGLDTALLNVCMQNPASLQRVAQDESDGRALGVTSTPTFFVNGVRVVGLPDAKAFDFVMKSQLEAASKSALK